MINENGEYICDECHNKLINVTNDERNTAPFELLITTEAQRLRLTFCSMLCLSMWIIIQKSEERKQHGY